MTLGGVSIVPLIVFAVTIFLVFRHPMVRIPFTRKYFHIDYASAVVIGILILFATFPIGVDTIYRGIIGGDNVAPYAIIILIIALAYICISLDFTGLYEYLSLRVVRASKGSGLRLFIYIFLLSCFLTIFTDNDIVILTMTPIIFYISKNAKLDPIPFLISQFFAANILGMTLYIGNPANVIAADAQGLTFVEFSKWMTLPSVVAVVVCLFMLWLVFRRRLPKKFDVPEVDPGLALKSRSAATFGTVVLALSIVFMSLPTSLLGVPLWGIALFFAIVMFFHDFFYYRYLAHQKLRSGSHSNVRAIMSRVPWKIIIFVVGLFIMVESLTLGGWTDLFASYLSNFSGSIVTLVLAVALLSTLASNVMNNQPMTIFFVRIFQSASFLAIPLPLAKLGSTLALVVGGNFGPNFTLIGALAGVMWAEILADKGCSISFSKFSKYGLIVMLPVLVLTALTLVLELMFFV